MAIKARFLRYSIGLAATTLAVGGFAATAASAAPGKAEVAEQHCTVSLETGAAQCFPTFREAIAHATGGRVTDAPDHLKGAMADGKLVAELNSVDDPFTIPVGIDYYLQGFAGASVTFSGTHPCTDTLTDNDFSRGPLTIFNGINWNNNIRSFQGLNNCYQQMWDNPDCTGLLWDFSGQSSDLLSGRDRTECIRWS